MSLKRNVKRPWMPEKKRHERWNNRFEGEFYHTPAWRKVRKIYIQKHPICEECERNGFITPAKVIDHIIPIRKGGAKLNFSNLQSLCIQCHASKSARDK